MSETLDTLFAHAARVPTFEQVFGDKSAGRLPSVCCVTGVGIRPKRDSWTRHALGNGYSVFALRRLSDERKAALTALTNQSVKPAKVVKEPTNG
jgi:hypothetical protein